MEKHPVLYSYRRCPYAMRARVTLYLCGIQVEQREIVFWDKPEPMLDVSPKGTVPVLVLPDGQVIDESRDIAFWAVENRTENSSNLAPKDLLSGINQWIDLNDNEFKDWLDKYKYADRFPDQSQDDYRQQALPFLDRLENSLAKSTYLLGDQISLADICTFTFIRQFANVDKNWWFEVDYPYLKYWLEKHLCSDYFVKIMKNRPTWHEGHLPLWLDEPELETRDQFVKKSESNL